MKLSIITPVLNAEEHLEGSIRSVMEQDYPDVEQIIVDGGSIDRTLEIARQFPQLRVISEPDRGIYDAMNKGVQLSRGEWLYFLGADDVFFDPLVLSEFTQHLSDEVDVVYGDVISDRFEGRYDGSFDAEKIYRTNICHQSLFFRKTLFDRIGVFDLKYKSHADWDHNMRWLLNEAVKSIYVDRVVANYADAGFSSLNPDPEFRNDKIFNYLEYGGNRIGRMSAARKLFREFLVSIRDLNLTRAIKCFRMMI